MGASPEGNRPFIDAYDLATKASKRLWRSEAPYYEMPVAMLDAAKGLVLTSRESTEVPPNYYVRNLRSGTLSALTRWENPYTALKGIKKELVQYQREDGLKLSGTLYLPAGYNKEKDGRLPVFMWAYPREYKTADAASQINGSPYQFIRPGTTSPLLWVTQGYAVFDDFAMPILGEGDKEPNETFVEQLRASAEAAVNKLVDMGVADRNRIAVGGHSYGAFMTANLLAHTDIFAAGVARSGAYNRTLTPFGFQQEERTYWQAPEIYYKMSPFNYAHQIKEPILLIHGEADNNSGTFPIQSERFYNALKGHGATAKLVFLPHESHGYRARESILHTLYETNAWMDKYVKNRPVSQVKP
jgi:dipeptidyl aminopeptidase/acylaminoacyl peptidase